MLSLGTETTRVLLSRFLPARVNQPCKRRPSSGIATLHLYLFEASITIPDALKNSYETENGVD